MASPAVSVATVLDRDRWCCARCGTNISGKERGWGWSVHHRRPRGAGGTSLAWVNQPANLIVLCGSGTTGCHGWAESHRDIARQHGYLVPLNGRTRADHTPIMHALHGWVVLDDNGGYRPAETEVPDA